MKKRMLSLALALVLCLGLALPAFAEEDDYGGVDPNAIYIELDSYSTLFGNGKLDETPITLKSCGNEVGWEITSLYRLRVKAEDRPVVGGMEGFCSGKLYVFVTTYNADEATVSGRTELIDALDVGTDEYGDAVMPTYGEIIETAKAFEGNAVMFEGMKGLYMLVLDTEASTESTKTEQPSQPAVTVPEDAITYTVKKGETLSDITTNFYGNNAQRYKLLKANGGKWKGAGQVLVLPAKLGKTARIPAPVCAEGEKLYTVKAGDTLGKIAQAEYGDVMQYKAIFQRNADRLKNANTIYVGQVIVLPALAK